MSDDLGLGELTDDQIVELARALADEAAARGSEPLTDAIRDVARGARAAAEARATAAEQAAEGARADVRAWSDWSLAKRVALMIDETVGRKWSFGVVSDYQGRCAEMTGTLFVNVGGRRQEKRMSARLLIDGTERHPPGCILYGGQVADHQGCAAGFFFGPGQLERIESILRFMPLAWDYRATVTVERALSASVEPAPMPADYDRLRLGS